MWCCILGKKSSTWINVKHLDCQTCYNVFMPIHTSLFMSYCTMKIHTRDCIKYQAVWYLISSFHASFLGLRGSGFFFSTQLAPPLHHSSKCFIFPLACINCARFDLIKVIESFLHLPYWNSQELFFKFLQAVLVTGDSVHCLNLKALVPEYDVVVLTPMILQNHFNRGLLKDLTVFTLLVFDECHHTRKAEPYNTLMLPYLKMKINNSRSPLPQVKF